MEKFEFNKIEAEAIEEKAIEDVLHSDGQVSKIHDLNEIIKDSKKNIKEIENNKGHKLIKETRIKAEKSLIKNLEEDKKEIIRNN